VSDQHQLDKDNKGEQTLSNHEIDTASVWKDG
jgi:hypothetical protein